jgi:class 3 adenylate cyclase
MVTLPRPILDYLFDRQFRDRSPAYLFTDAQGRVRQWGGAIASYGLSALRRGEPVEGPLVFMQGLLPLEESALELSCVTVEARNPADVYILSDAGGYWILLLDATAEAHQRGIIQQRTNELVLLQDQQRKILDRFLGPERVARLSRWTLQETGHKQPATIMFADLRGFTAYAQERDPNIVFKTLNGYLRAMIEPILSTSGVVDKIIGDGVMALFGLEREPSPPEVGAVQAAVRVVGAVRKLSVEHPEASGAVLGVGVGIASGQVALGILGSHDRRDLSVIGHNVNLAARLEHEARPGEILIDALTFDSIGTLQDRFRPRVLALKGLPAALQVYACGVDQ